MTSSDQPVLIYERSGVQVFHGKCAEVLPILGANSAHLLVTDPPYGKDWQSGRRSKDNAFEKLTGDSSEDRADIAEGMRLAVRALHRGRHAYVFGPTDIFPDELTGRTELIWDKQLIGTGNLSSPWGTSHEPITFGSFEPSQVNRKKGYGAGVARMRSGSVLSYQRPNGSGVARHPTEKPVALLRRLVESSSRIGETVLDPFAGSGSTLVAAIVEGRSAIGIEIDEHYARLCAERCDRAIDAYEMLMVGL